MIERNEYGYPIAPIELVVASHQRPTSIPQASHNRPTPLPDGWPNPTELTADERATYDVWGLPVGMPL